MINAIAYLREIGIEGIPRQDRPMPDLVFSGRYDMRVGDLEIQLIAVPGAETNDSLIVWLPQHKIVFTGNLFGCPFGHFPNLITIRGDRYRDALVCAEAVQTVLDLDAEMILYGHHAPIVGAELIREELSCLKAAILHVHDETVKGMNAGKDVHTLMSEIEIPPEIEVGQGYGKVSWGVRAIWENYAGWFHHASTTELYAVPASAVDQDLIDLAGGPDALVARARTKLESGRLEEAVHLTDIVLRALPGEPGATDVSIAAHEALEATSENFWLSAWLRKQIEKMTAERAA
jgi:alkyl sulfatase BDS1-like metallo-beta-lactamase superfamily hydrolase